MSITLQDEQPSTSTTRWLARCKHFLLDADHLAAVNKFLPWRYAFGCLCLVAVAATLCGIWVHAHAHALLGGVVLVLLVGTAWPWLSTRGLSGAVSFDRARAREGEPVGVRLRLSNWLPFGAWGLRIHGGLGKGQGAVGLAVAPGWRQTAFNWDFTPDRRGAYPPRPPRASTGFPFGLWEASKPLAIESSLLVWPATFPINGVPELTSNSRSREGVVPQNRAGHSGDVLGTRPYRAGDPRRRIHWGQTARYDRLIVCEQQATASPRVQLVLDADPAAHAGSGPNNSLEWAVRVIASLAEALTVQGVLVEAVWDGTVHPAATGAAHRIRLLDSLARLGDSQLSLDRILALPACRQFTDGLQIVVTTDQALIDHPEVVAQRRPRFVVLRTGAFGGVPCPETQAHAWITLNDPANVPEQFRRRWREVQCAN